jgi:hypothetical protein
LTINTGVKTSETRRQLFVDCTVAAGSATVSVRTATTILCTGTAVLGNTATLAEANDSGVSGTVAVGVSTTTDTGASLYYRFPSSALVYRDTSNPPTTLRVTVPFDGYPGAVWTETSALTAGTYYYKIAFVSDTGETGTASAVQTVIVPGAPVAPTNLAYVSGNESATVVSWTASTTPGATYRLYLQQPGDAFMDLLTPAVASASSPQTLPAIAGTGTAYVIVRAVNGGVEEKNVNLLGIEYSAAGARIPPRPNDCTLADVGVTVGDLVAATIVYANAGEAGTATVGQLFARIPSGTYDFTTPTATGTLAAGVSSGLKKIALTATLAEGWWYLTGKVATAAGTQSTNQAPEQLVYVSNSAPAAPVITRIGATRG